MSISPSSPLLSFDHPLLHHSYPLFLPFLGSSANSFHLPVTQPNRTDVQQVPRHLLPPSPSVLWSLSDISLLVLQRFLRLVVFFSRKQTNTVRVHQKKKAHTMLLSSPSLYSMSHWHPLFSLFLFPIALLRSCLLLFSNFLLLVCRNSSCLPGCWRPSSGTF